MSHIASQDADWIVNDVYVVGDDLFLLAMDFDTGNSYIQRLNLPKV
jgi:hypothetical protein